MSTLRNTLTIDRDNDQVLSGAMSISGLVDLYTWCLGVSHIRAVMYLIVSVFEELEHSKIVGT
jgi:hypothetical protein